MNTETHSNTLIRFSSTNTAKSLSFYNVLRSVVLEGVATRLHLRGQEKHG